MRVPSVTILDGEGMNLRPVFSRGTFEYDYATRRKNHVTVGAAPKREVDVTFKPYKIREGVMFVVIEHLPKIINRHLVSICFPSNGR